MKQRALFYLVYGIILALSGYVFFYVIEAKEAPYPVIFLGVSFFLQYYVSAFFISMTLLTRLVLTLVVFLVSFVVSEIAVGLFLFGTKTDTLFQINISVFLLVMILGYEVYFMVKRKI